MIERTIFSSDHESFRDSFRKFIEKDKVDDPRFDPMWEACAAARLPVFIHVADPEDGTPDGRHRLGPPRLDPRAGRR